MRQNAFARIPERILSWYDLHQRDLPWRHTRDPYFIWVAEVMLQQTQVETVIPYYRRFLSRFPTIQSLAKATLQEVLKTWENMGYYARARHLHRASREIMKEMRGEIPRSWDELIRLPGVGSYTASAILSFAFGERVPTVDSNVKRVIARLFCVQDPINKSRAKERINRLAAQLIPKENPDRFNQGIMELGAILCIPRTPSCPTCPVQGECSALERELQTKLPVTGKRKTVPHKTGTAALIRGDQGRLLIVQRPINGLLGGLWKFPGGFTGPGEGMEEGLRRSVREELGVEIGLLGPFTSVKHAYTHFRMTLQVFLCVLRSGKPKALGCSRWQWVEPQKLAPFPFSRADQKIMEAFE